MLVEGNPAIGGIVSDALSGRGHKSGLGRVCRKRRRNFFHDAIYIGQSFDALLADYHLADSSALRIIRDFRSEFRKAPVGLMTHQNDIATAIWANSKRHSDPRKTHPRARTNAVDNRRRSGPGVIHAVILPGPCPGIQRVFCRRSSRFGLRFNSASRDAELLQSMTVQLDQNIGQKRMRIFVVRIEFQRARR